MANPKEHMYLHIWERIKTRDKCSVTVMPNAVSRVKKAVMKEKYKDRAFAMMNLDTYRLRIKYIAAENKLVFQLIPRIGIFPKELP